MLLASLFILVAAGWIVSYYINTVGSLRAGEQAFSTAGVRAVRASRPNVQPVG